MAITGGYKRLYLKNAREDKTSRRTSSSPTFTWRIGFVSRGTPLVQKRPHKKLTKMSVVWTCWGALTADSCFFDQSGPLF